MQDLACTNPCSVCPAPCRWAKLEIDCLTLIIVLLRAAPKAAPIGARKSAVAARARWQDIKLLPEDGLPAERRAALARCQQRLALLQEALGLQQGRVDAEEAMQDGLRRSKRSRRKYSAHIIMSALYLHLPCVTIPCTYAQLSISWQVWHCRHAAWLCSIAGTHIGLLTCSADEADGWDLGSDLSDEEVPVMDDSDEEEEDEEEEEGPSHRRKRARLSGGSKKGAAAEYELKMKHTSAADILLLSETCVRSFTANLAME
jgi:hypothetical protein